MAKDKSEMITLSTVHKETKIPLRTLQHAASRGHLIAIRQSSPVGDYYQTTWDEVERWKKLYYHPKKTKL